MSDRMTPMPFSQLVQWIDVYKRQAFLLRSL